jgi:hypothetical protein
VQRASRAAFHDLLLGFFRLLARALGGERDKGVDLRIEIGNAPQERIGELNRRQLPCADQLSRIRDAQEVEVFHDRCSQASAPVDFAFVIPHLEFGRAAQAFRSPLHVGHDFESRVARH